MHNWNVTRLELPPPPKKKCEKTTSFDENVCNPGFSLLTMYKNSEILQKMLVYNWNRGPCKASIWYNRMYAILSGCTQFWRKTEKLCLGAIIKSKYYALNLTLNYLVLFFRIKKIMMDIFYPIFVAVGFNWRKFWTIEYSFLGDIGKSNSFY